MISSICDSETSTHEFLSPFCSVLSVVVKGAFSVSSSELDATFSPSDVSVIDFVSITRSGVFSLELPRRGASSLTKLYILFQVT